MKLVFMVEDLSTKRFLESFLPRLLPAADTIIIPHEGKSDLERSLPRKLRAWQEPNARFVVVRDQDSGDCRVIKDNLARICRDAGKPETLVRIACRELEAWYFGDLHSTARALDAPILEKLEHKTEYREPDKMGSPSRELVRLVPEFGKVLAAGRVGSELSTTTSTSASFLHLILGLRRLGGA